MLTLVYVLAAIVLVVVCIMVAADNGGFVNIAKGVLALVATLAAMLAVLYVFVRGWLAIFF